MMAEQELEHELHSCGLWFFIEFYEQLQTFSSETEDLQEDIRQQIINELKFKHRPDGGHYQDTGTDIRIGSAFVIFKKDAQEMALSFIIKSNRIDSESKGKAITLLKSERSKRYEIQNTQESIQPKIQKTLLDTEIKTYQPIIETISEPILENRVNQDKKTIIINMRSEYTDSYNKTSKALLNVVSRVYVTISDNLIR